MKKLKVGIVGIGKISGIYLENLTGMFSDAVEVTALADLVPERATEAAEKYGIPEALSVEKLVASGNVELVLNLTIPNAHFDVCMKAVEAGKHTYVEKPLCITREEATRLLETAEKRGVRVGCAPDTFLGAGIQTCRKLIDDGWIGTPVAATAFMMGHGHESWHPDPEFYYKVGGGPMFDMGPYYLTALVNLMGPVARLSGSAKKTFETRLITSEPKKGTVIDVDVPTHVVGVMDFASGAVGTIITSFDIWGHTLPRIEIYGTEGSLSVPDPNTFGGPIKVRRSSAPEWSDIPLAYGYSENSRGLGVADIARAVAGNTDHRASGKLAYHVLELMHGFHDASSSGTYYAVQSTCDRPEALPMTR
ncbi:MAG: gfo/Idh/MocA family oxidoreductase [Spirochaetaceae bacterium]|nr:MAG: gfo/Idh/MocA family oxidoreductase [Spirochaetaceae bacterium]